MPSHPTTAADKKWEAEMDANTLADAEAIHKTPVRLNRAKIAARRLATEQQKKATAMTKIARRKKK